MRLKFNRLLFLLFFVQNIFLTAQVGIGTTTPSAAAMLEISPGDGTQGFKGFMPPLMTIAQRDLINVTVNDVGLLVFINDTVTGIQCLQFYTGTTWVCANDPTNVGFTVFAAQDFDATTSWNFNLNPAAYNVNDDVWGIVNNLAAITGFTANFFGCSDLDNPNGGGDFDHTIAFNNVDVSAAISPKVSFDYDVFQFDAGDDAFYELFYDDVGQGTVFLVDGIDNGGGTGVSQSGTVTVNIPVGVTNVRLTVSVNQDGAADTAGFDNFRVFE